MRWSVALEELFVYFLGIPALGYTAGALWVRYTMKNRQAAARISPG